MTKNTNGGPDAFPEDLRSFLDAERDLDALEAEARDRLFTRLAASLLPSSGGVAGAGDTNASAVAAGVAVRANSNGTSRRARNTERSTRSEARDEKSPGVDVRKQREVRRGFFR